MDLLEFAVYLLVALTGGLRTSAGATAAQLETVRRLIARCVFLHQTEPFVAGETEASFGPQAVLLFADESELEPEELADLRGICTNVQAALESDPDQTLDIRVFRRELPVNAELPEARPAWAVGAAVDQTIGPFTSLDHRPVWFDVYRTTQFVSLVNAAVGAPVAFLPRVALQEATDYEFPAGTVWLSAQMLASSAPQDGYCGVRVAGANLRVNGLAEVDVSAIHFAPGSELRLELELDPPAHPIDLVESALHPARITATYPTRLTILISAGGVEIEDLSDAEVGVFGANVVLRFERGTSATYDAGLGRILVDLTSEAAELTVAAEAAQLQLSGATTITRAAWALPIARPHRTHLFTAVGAGAIALTLEAGLAARWRNLPGPARLGPAQLLIEPTGSTVHSMAVNERGGQRFELWRDRSAQTHNRCLLQLDYPRAFPLWFRMEADTSEALAVVAVCQARFDRPLTAAGTAVVTGARNSRVVMVSGPAAGAGLRLYSTAPAQATVQCFALRNALLRTRSLEALFIFGALDFGALDAGADGLERGVARLQFAVDAVVPILPDPYAANFDVPRSDQFTGEPAALLASVRWADAEDAPDIVVHLRPSESGDPALRDLFPRPRASTPPQPRQTRDEAVRREDRRREQLLRQRVDEALGALAGSLVAVDVSSNADQLGVGLAPPPDEGAHTLIRGQDLVSEARNVHLFMLPQVQWEPVWTIQNPRLFPFPSPIVFADDGGPTVLGVDTVNLVPIDPALVARSLVATLRQDPTSKAAALFTLPFGIKALAYPLSRRRPGDPPGASVELSLVQPRDPERDVHGGVQISVTAIDPRSTRETESPSLPGMALQLRNAIDPVSEAHLAVSVLGDTAANSVEDDFNTDFSPASDERVRVPVTRIDFSGYGASVYSHWRNPRESTRTSQVLFEVHVGRTAHEVVQIRSILYPWAVRVVRTISIERTAGGGVFRRDSGWVAQSNGAFEFPRGAGIKTHPGVVKGVFNVDRIRDTTHLFNAEMGGVTVQLQAVRFDADVLIADAVVGVANGFVRSVDQVGYVQIAPEGPLTPQQYGAVMAAEGPMGGPIDCVVDIGRSGLKMRVSRVDVAAAPLASGAIEFAAAARGSLLLPKDGQWSVVRQPLDEAKECVPADGHTGVPLVRQGDSTVADAVNTAPYVLAEPADLFVPGRSGYSTALLWSMTTQRVLFARPHVPKGERAIRSVVAPLLADPFTIPGPAVFPAAVACLRVPFPNYSLEIIGDGQVRLSWPEFAARPGGTTRREVARGVTTSTVVDYRDTRFRITLDSAAPEPWTYEQSGVALIQERGGREAVSSHGLIRASSHQAARWTLQQYRFGSLFDDAKGLLPLLKNGIGTPVAVPAGLHIPPGSESVPIQPLEDEKEQWSVRVEFEIPKGLPVLIGTTKGGHVEIKMRGFEYASLEALAELKIAEIFPAAALLKIESEQLGRRIFPKGEKRPTQEYKVEVILAIGALLKNEYVVVPFGFKWEIFLGFGFVYLTSPTADRVGLAIVFQATGSVRYPWLGAGIEEEDEVPTLAEVAINVEGQAYPVVDGQGVRHVECHGKLAFELTVCWVVNIEWELAEGKIFSFPV